MRRLLLVAVLALAAAAPAAATVPQVPSGSAVGDGVPLKAYATLTPPVHLFGDPITASLAVVADTRWVDPARLRVTASFGPYIAPHGPRVVRLAEGRFEQVTWTWTLRCVTADCVPRFPPSDAAHVFRFPSARIDYVGLDGRRSYGIRASWPHIIALSELNPAALAALEHVNGGLPWRFHVAPLAAPRFRVSPSLLFWLALAVGIALGAAALVLAGTWLRNLRPRVHTAPTFEGAGSPLERALLVLSWAREHDDETLQRKALERIADELDSDAGDAGDAGDADELMRRARELAWSSRGPAGEDVETLSEEARQRGHTAAPGAEERP